MQRRVHRADLMNPCRYETFVPRGESPELGDLFKNYAHRCVIEISLAAPCSSYGAARSEVDRSGRMVYLSRIRHVAHSFHLNNQKALHLAFPPLPSPSLPTNSRNSPPFEGYKTRSSQRL